MPFNNQSMRMRRRDFIVSVGISVGSASIVAPVFSAPVALDSGGHEFQALRHSVHAHFGSGFRLCSAERLGGETDCLIENLGNFLRVSSPDAHNWTIREATEM